MDIWLIPSVLQACVQLIVNGAATSGALFALAAQAQPVTSPEGTSTALWANLIWIAVGIFFLVLLVAIVMLAMRHSGPGDRRMRQ